MIFLTAQNEASVAVDLMRRGALDFLLKPVELNQLLLSVSRALEHRRLIIENENYRFHLEQLVLEQTKALNQALTGLEHVHSATLDALSMALDFRDQSTSGHSRRVAELTAGAASAMGIKDAALVQIENGALLHGGNNTCLSRRSCPAAVEVIPHTIIPSPSKRNRVTT